MSDVPKSEGFVSDQFIPLATGGYLMRKGKPISLAEFTALTPMQQASTITANNPEFKARISAANKGVKRSDETKAKLKAAKKGIPLTEEEKARLSAALKGKVRTAETKARMSAAWKLRPPISAETRAKMSASIKNSPGHAKSVKAAAESNTVFKVDGLSMRDWFEANKITITSDLNWKETKDKIADYVMKQNPTMHKDRITAKFYEYRKKWVAKGL